MAMALAGAPAHAQQAKQTVIRVEIEETHDRLDPDPRSGITRKHTFTVTLSGNNHVSEVNTTSRLNRRGGEIVVDQRESSEVIGDNNSHVVWHVLGPRKLQRIGQGKQYFIAIWNIEISETNQCQIDVKYLEQTGFTYVVMKRSDNGELAHFSLPRVLNASCTIE